ncbi:MAG: efflux RND transporter periplasmic adaptor subunit [Gemmatimonadaceae bacterium]
MSIAFAPASHLRLRETALAVAAVFAVACAEPPPPATPPPEVTVVTLATQPLANRITLPGRLQGIRTAEVRARVNGVVRRKVYTEGTDVRAGDVLFEIDPREWRAQLSAAEATLARAEATAANATQDARRYEGLVSQQAISQQEYDAATARMRTAEADVAQARAGVDAARLNLSYTTITAPISGRAGRAEVTEGAYVSAASATLLTRVEQVHPILANFSQSGSEILDLRRAVATGAGNTGKMDQVKVHLVLQDGSEYPHVGHLNFLDLSVDEATGTTALRAEFANPDRILLPGQFVRVSIETASNPNGILVPQRAVTVTPQGASLMVVTAGDTATVRNVQVGELQGGSWVILSGVSAGERVIVDGLQKVRPGSPVRVSGPANAPALADTAVQAPR